MSSSSGQLSASVRSEVLLSCRRPRLELIAAGSRREAPRGSPPEPQGDFLSCKSCAPWHALSARPGPGACLPGCCLHHWPISSRGPGARPREPLPPNPHPRSTAGFRTKGRDGGGSSPLFAPPPHPIAGSVPATLGSSKSLAQPEEPRLAQVWPPRIALLFPLSPWHLFRRFLGSMKEVWGCL